MVICSKVDLVRIKVVEVCDLGLCGVLEAAHGQIRDQREKASFEDTGRAEEEPKLRVKRKLDKPNVATCRFLTIEQVKRRQIPIHKPHIVQVVPEEPKCHYRVHRNENPR